MTDETTKPKDTRGRPDVDNELQDQWRDALIPTLTIYYQDGKSDAFKKSDYAVTFLTGGVWLKAWEGNNKPGFSQTIGQFIPYAAVRRIQIDSM